MLSKITFCCWLITDDNELLAIQICLKAFTSLINDVRKANATWNGGSTAETLLQDANLNDLLMYKQ